MLYYSRQSHSAYSIIQWSQFKLQTSRYLTNYLSYLFVKLEEVNKSYCEIRDLTIFNATNKVFNLKF